MTLVLELEKIEKIFGGLRAIGGVSFQVEPKQIFGLIGPNGAGKTTIFNCVTGVYRPEHGDVRFCGQSLLGRKPFQIALAGVGRTFQNIRLFGEMTVLENVMVAAHSRAKMNVFGALFRSGHHEATEAKMQARAEELLEIFELQTLKDEPAGSLPYGSQRRLEIARALMLDPKLLLLDEPAAGMNSKEADKLKEQVRWLRDRFGLSIVLVEHNMQVVMGVCEHVHCVDHGETIASGTPAVVQNHPAVLAAYLGQDEEAARESMQAIETGTIGELIQVEKAHKDEVDREAAAEIEAVLRESPSEDAEDEKADEAGEKKADEAEEKKADEAGETKADEPEETKAEDAGEKKAAVADATTKDETKEKKAAAEEGEA